MAAAQKYKDELIRTANALVADGKGLLAADESIGSIEKRFKAVNVENTEERRESWRDVLFTAPGELGKYLGGIITFEETLMKHKDSNGTPLVKVIQNKGIVPGIKTDKGTVKLPGTDGETSTQGLDGLAERSEQHYKQGARFAKWRCTYKISDTTPTPVAISSNAHVLARYAAISQTAGLCPIIEPELLMEGEFTLERSLSAHIAVLSAVFHELHAHNVLLEGMLLKVSMVILPDRKASPEQVAKATCTALSQTVPPALPGILFLSGGQGDEEAIKNLQAINKIANKDRSRYPWKLSFSYGRALQGEPMKAWAKGDNKKAQELFLERAKWCWQASRGEYKG